MRTFHGRVVTPGCAQAEALVSHGGLNTLASFQKSLQFGDKTAKCGDQNNPDLYGKPMAGKALCLPQTIGSTTGGLVLYCAEAIAWAVREAAAQDEKAARELREHVAAHCSWDVTVRALEDAFATLP